MKPRPLAFWTFKMVPLCVYWFMSLVLEPHVAFANRLGSLIWCTRQGQKGSWCKRTIWRMRVLTLVNQKDRMRGQIHTYLTYVVTPVIPNLLLTNLTPPVMVFKVFSHTRLRARVHYTSSTLIGGKGGAGPSSLHTHYAWGTNGVCECKMDVKSTWIPMWYRMDHVSRVSKCHVH
jgi:hypothetical protein